jgi:hypothetical protein
VYEIPRAYFPVPPRCLKAADNSIPPALGNPVPGEGLNGSQEASTLYEPLDVDNYEFRVLSISPDANNSPIRCTLRKTSLINERTAASYNALSYCWGDPNFRLKIFVNGVQMAVTVNLYDATWQLRALKIYDIWVDAICINQEDKTERSLQVRFMKRIYERARGVIAWLGMDSRNSSDALNFLSQPLEPNALNIEASDRVRSVLYHFFELSYWKRVWIIQEVAVGSSVTILCGPHKMDWSLLATVEMISPIFDATGWRHVNQVRSFRHTYQNHTRISLIDAMHKSHAAQSTDSRDKIYALLGLTYDGDDLVPYPNYKQPIVEVLRDFTKAMMKSKRTLDFLLFRTPWQLEQKDLPTWVMDWVGLRPGKRGFPDAETLPRSNFMLVELPDPNMLRVRGEILSTISNTFDYLAVSTTSLPVYQLAQEYHNLHDKYSNAISNAICASLCLEIVGELDIPSKDSRQGFFSSLWTENGQLDPERHAQLLQALQDPSPPIKHLGLEFFESKRSFETEYDAWGKKLQDEKDLIPWLVRIGSWQIAGKLFRQWLATGKADTSTATGFFASILYGIVSRKPDYSPVIRSLFAFYQNRLKLVVTTDRIIGTACAMVRRFDKVCLLEGTRENTPVLLRLVTTRTGAVVYKVVGGILLSERESDPQKYPSRISDQYFNII